MLGKLSNKGVSTTIINDKKVTTRLAPVCHLPRHQVCSKMTLTVFLEPHKGVAAWISEDYPLNAKCQATFYQLTKLRAKFRPKANIATQQDVALGKPSTRDAREGNVFCMHADLVQPGVRCHIGKHLRIRVAQQDTCGRTLSAKNAQ